MRKLLTAAMAAITLGGAVCATAAPAEAGPHGGYYGGGYYGGHHNDAGVAVAAGVVGLALGAALANNHGYYDRGYYGPGYYGGSYGGGYYAPGYYGAGYYPGYYGYPGYRLCASRHWVWDPYIGRRVLVRSRYAC
ncbi:hypothetical protein [Phenylobacterium sp.]|uniref:hypothetical protein n=1 Tax=Phenylobacterium sp. TaxID=1871053 RepID=UPI002E37A8C9|nr:hypothetical protein [Phenylobacterium sp.]HEX4712546.1 hypothetical protein [Phenylobacterium sp.]